MVSFTVSCPDSMGAFLVGLKHISSFSSFYTLKWQWSFRIIKTPHQVDDYAARDIRGKFPFKSNKTDIAQIASALTQNVDHPKSWCSRDALDD